MPQFKCRVESTSSGIIMVDAPTAEDAQAMAEAADKSEITWTTEDELTCYVVEDENGEEVIDER